MSRLTYDMPNHPSRPRILIEECDEKSSPSASSSSTCFSSPHSDALPTPLLVDDEPSDVRVMSGSDQDPPAPSNKGGCRSQCRKELSSLDLVHFGDYSSYQGDGAEHVNEDTTGILLSTRAHSATFFGSIALDAHQYSKKFPPQHTLNATFVNTYELRDELGSGGFGFVMTAYNREQNLEVAVKFIIKDKIPEHAWMYDDVMGYLPAEILLLSYLDHPNIVKCLDVFEDDVYFYLVQELHGTPWSSYQRPESDPFCNSPVPGLSPSASELSIEDSAPSTPPPPSFPPAKDRGKKQKHPYLGVDRPICGRRPSHDLFECIEQSEDKRIPEQMARHIFSQIVDAVAYLDAHGVTHRDIKDENIVIDKDFTVKLIDFGSAVIFDPDLPRPFYHAFFGTTAYAASEILSKKPYQTAPAEVWTLGVLLSYLLTGSSPFPSDRDAIAGRIVLTHPRKEDSLPSEDALDLMQMCLHPDPSERITIEQIRDHPWLADQD